MQTLRFHLDADAAFVSFEVFSRTLSDLRALLRDVEAGVIGSQEAPGAVVVADLRMGSLETSVRYTPADDREETAEDVARTLIDGLSELEELSSMPPRLSSRGVALVRRIAARFGPGGVVRLDVSRGVPGGTHGAAITRRAGEHASSVLRVAHQAIGAVRGRLEAVDVHERRVARVYPPGLSGGVVCRFEDDLFTDVQAALGRSVIVHGIIERNAAGQPVRLDLRRIEVTHDPVQSPSVDDLVGIDPEFTGDRSTDEYIRWQRNG